ncbi:MAG: hypothetical protein KGL34_01465 [Gammaproteobacteria bacterium]|nr:hypothetical protein [Gammaproteobacteria bacterium]MDE2304200.1 hypothetical protein [Gammaproteobacteria bacterium]
MPIIERDPWRYQYFAEIDCPEHVRVPTDDADAWALSPSFRWVYDKLAVAVSQGLDCAPHGVEPAHYPVFSKPIVNLRGMGIDSRVLATPEDYRQAERAGHMWMRLLEGPHVSTDFAVQRGAVRWWRHAVGQPGPGGTFDHWVVEADGRPALEEYCVRWIETHLADYTGMLNLESIGGRIIEAHLRFADQWPDLYGPGWVEAVIGLYARGLWEFSDADRRDGYSVVLFGPHGRRYRHPPAAILEEVRSSDQVRSLQIPFHETRAAEAHPMPPGGFRLAIVNCDDLAVGRRMRAKLARAYGLEDGSSSDRDAAR